VTYEPPSGWLEEYAIDPEASYVIRQRFHIRRDCPRIRPESELRPVDRPYTAVRCTACGTRQ